MLLANIASMGKSGKYEVELKDNTKKELQNLNQEEFDELIEQQKNAPKTVEAVQKSQLGVLENIYSTLESAVNQLRYGAAGVSLKIPRSAICIRLMEQVLVLLRARLLDLIRQRHIMFELMLQIVLVLVMVAQCLFQQLGTDKRQQLQRQM